MSTSPINDSQRESNWSTPPIPIKSNMSFHDPSILLPVPVPHESESLQFGVVTFTIGEIPITTDTLALFISIDQSASMEMVSSDGTTRIASAKHFAKNLLRFVADINAKHGSNVFVCITGFDDQINPITDSLRLDPITNENVEDMCHQIEHRLYARGSTDIEQILKYTNTLIADTHAINPDYKLHHLLLTDGEITAGCDDTSILRNHLHPCCSNILVGFGKDHCAKTLIDLASRNVTGDKTNKNSYLFVDKTEFAARICADVIFGMFYGAIENPTIRVTDGLIYDTESRTWQSTTNVGTFCAEKTYTFYISSSTPTKTECLLNGNTKYIARESEDVIESVETMPDLIDDNDIVTINNTYTDCTLNLLTYHVLRVLTKIKNRTRAEYRSPQCKKHLADEIDALFTIIKGIREGLEANTVAEPDVVAAYKRLEDDTYIAHKTVNMSKNRATMFCASRELTQTRQYSYNPTAVNDDCDGDEDDDCDRPAPCMRRSNAMPVRHMNNASFRGYEDEDDIQQLDDGMSGTNDLFKGHKLEDNANTPIRSATLSGVVRQLTR